MTSEKASVAATTSLARTFTFDATDVYRIFEDQKKRSNYGSLKTNKPFQTKKGAVKNS